MTTSQTVFATTEPKQEPRPEKFDTPEAELQWALDHPPTEDDKLKAQAESYVYYNGAEAAVKFGAALTEAAAAAEKAKVKAAKTEAKAEHETHHSGSTRA